MASQNIKLIANNRRARHDYFIEESLECGLVLMGSEIKAIRQAKVSLQDAYCQIKGNELYVVGMRIGAYSQANQFNHEEDRTRKLLAHKREIIKLERSVSLKSMTLVPLRLYLKEGLAKLEVAVARGKKLYDKRESEKAKTSQRQIERAIKNYGR